MTGHILNRPAPPAGPKPAAQPKPTPVQAKVLENLRRTKLAEAVGRAISRTKR
jgi:hypothetical protein